MYYDDLDFEELERLHKNLVQDLEHIADLSGEFTLSEDAHKFMSKWYEENADEGDSNSHKLSGYFERKPAHIHKIAMILHIAYSDTLVLDQKDFEEAIELLKMIEKKLPNVFQGIGRNPYTVDIYRMLEFITERGRVSKEEIRRYFLHAATPTMLNELMDGLHAAGYVTVEIVGDGAYLKSTNLLKNSVDENRQPEQPPESDSPAETAE
jgi:hypothetical protein